MSAGNPQPLQSALFPESAEERANRWDAEILALLVKRGGGPFSQEMSEAECKVLQAIRYHRGVNNAINIRAIASTTGLSDRQIKGAVRVLRVSFCLPIASSKHSARGGYYLWMTQADLDVWKGDQLDQIRAEIAVFRAATSEAAALDIVKQLWAGVTP